ncbi:MAG: 23S rRNA (guanosine(2251)-2'-O)-methyltransferase RlmB [Actinomyces sp.]|jgi:23S rRNA (guanosine2251-2'-O)-methyltransferase|nr:23S rRNA (guanosine(2251)-2'-O)-methyltransferase RlmB [Actinomyces sp.]MCI1642676.1 23S rRNA (guanosine(2251)-2'-O)-methyltransferase RlmB [Actinomyces sp.]MCI1662922.1 23S rRNA (guanosine(2251)-2'-O)-methyltransferase RlmB [Actinomyces sp.]MCI1691849.1 23S rRNA (guanosine(2251)-2'-O)-methyltransferase RlmB [Actinomyces sp.]MCI1787870.1 23S rRNA (guanosine(2251)-2'-O)-methyltransferase RlmB [Actinomyces sp.]MCI1829794.1 23S rRNA (guanosine(2251)-2'-O)-methyltransferase RlmB [Actinomyces sp
MAGNQGRRGAVRKPTTKKGARVGTGGHGRKALEGRGPTPKAEDRTYHPAHKRKVAREKRAEQDAAIARARAKTSIRLPEGHELIAGRNPVAEAVRAEVPVERVFVIGNIADDRVEEVVRAAARTGAPVVEVTRRDLDVASDGAAHQGVAIEVPAYQYAQVEDLIADSMQQIGAPLLVALDQVTDPHNLGAVLRSSGAFGADGVVIPERRSAGVTTAAWKVSAGAAARVPVARATNLVRALQECKKAGFFVVGLDGGSDVPIRGLGLAAEPLVIVTGAEGTGLSRLVRETCDQVVSIPISSRVESLNAAVATGIALYEVVSVRAGSQRAAAE